MANSIFLRAKAFYQANTKSTQRDVDITNLFDDATLPHPTGVVVNILDNFANDAAAATGGVPIGGSYHTSGAVKVRLT